MMSGIRGKDTRLEMIVRRGLHRRGLRYRLHVREVPGKPDLVFPRFGAVVFANGCFWHGHDCHLFRMPGTRTEFWTSKITRNRMRDGQVREELLAGGWRNLTIWECALKGRCRIPEDQVLDTAAAWIRGTNDQDSIGEIRGSS